MQKSIQPGGNGRNFPVSFSLIAKTAVLTAEVCRGFISIIYFMDSQDLCVKNVIMVCSD